MVSTLIKKNASPSRPSIKRSNTWSIKNKVTTLWVVGTPYTKYYENKPTSEEVRQYRKNKNSPNPRMERATTIQHIKYVGLPNQVRSSIGLEPHQSPIDWDFMLLTYEEFEVPLGSDLYLVYTPMPLHNDRVEEYTSAVIGITDSEDKAGKTVKQSKQIGARYIYLDLSGLSAIEG
jgi:hypothetical protein